MSKSFLKLVDYALVPAVVMVLSKVLGVYLVGMLFDIDVSMQRYEDSLFSYAPEVSIEDIKTISSYSDLIMFTAVAVIFSIILIRAIFLHSSHIKPTLMTTLASKNLFSLIYTSYDIYHAGAVSLIFSWAATILIFSNVLMAQTYAWVGILAFFSSVIMTVMLLHDVYREINNIKKNPGSYEWR